MSNRYLTKEAIQVANRHRIKCSMSYVIREIQIKTIITHIRMAKIQITENTKFSQGATGTLFH